MSFSTVKALNLLEKKLKGGWVKGQYATDSGGNGVETDSELATSFCLQGGVDSLTCGRRFKTSVENRLEKAIEAKLGTEGDTSLIGFNDRSETTLEDVLSVIRDARKAAQSDRARRTIRSARKAKRDAVKF